MKIYLTPSACIIQWKLYFINFFSRSQNTPEKEANFEHELFDRKFNFRCLCVFYVSGKWRRMESRQQHHEFSSHVFVDWIVTYSVFFSHSLCRPSRSAYLIFNFKRCWMSLPPSAHSPHIKTQPTMELFVSFQKIINQQYCCWCCGYGNAVSAANELPLNSKDFEQPRVELFKRLQR